MSGTSSAQKRLNRDKEELLKIRGATILDSNDPYVINLRYQPHQESSRVEECIQQPYQFRIAIPQKYPFVPPTWKWVSRPCQRPHPCLGPDGVVSVEALSQWTPANSLSNVLISLFPSCTLADQCSSVTSHLWNLKHKKQRPALTVTNPEVLDCLAAYLVEHDPATAHALHSTCRAAAAAVQDAMTSLSVVGRHADLVHTAIAFPGLSSLKFTQCAVLVQGLFAALRTLPSINSFMFEPSTAMLWAVYNNEGRSTHAAGPLGEEQKLPLPEEAPKPIPWEWASMWVGLASVTQLTSLSVSIPLSDRLQASPQRDANRRAWPAAAAIADYAFSPKCLSSMPRLRQLSLEMQHIIPSSRSPTLAEDANAENGNGNGNGNGNDNQNQNNPAHQIAGWSLPQCNLKSFSISGIPLGAEQLNCKSETQKFWGALESLHIGHTAVTEELQANALKLIVQLAKNVQHLDVASVEELLAKLSVDPSGPVSYKSLTGLRSLHTSLTSQLRDVPQLTHIKLYHTATYLNLGTLAAELPELRALEGLPFRPTSDHKNYWPLRQCTNLTKLTMRQGPSGAEDEIREILGPNVTVEVPVWSSQNCKSLAVFRRGFVPAHRPILSCLLPLSCPQLSNVTSTLSDSEFECVAAQGYALGYDSSNSDSGLLDEDNAVHTPTGPTSAARAGLTISDAPVAHCHQESPQNCDPNMPRTSVDVHQFGSLADPSSLSMLQEAQPDIVAECMQQIEQGVRRTAWEIFAGSQENVAVAQCEPMHMQTSAAAQEDTGAVSGRLERCLSRGAGGSAATAPSSVPSTHDDSEPPGSNCLPPNVAQHKRMGNKKARFTRCLRSASIAPPGSKPYGPFPVMQRECRSHFGSTHADLETWGRHHRQHDTDIEGSDLEGSSWRMMSDGQGVSEGNRRPASLSQPHQDEEMQDCGLSLPEELMSSLPSEDAEPSFAAGLMQQQDGQGTAVGAFTAPLTARVGGLGGINNQQTGTNGFIFSSQATAAGFSTWERVTQSDAPDPNPLSSGILGWRCGGTLGEGSAEQRSGRLLPWDLSDRASHSDLALAGARASTFMGHAGMTQRRGATHPISAFEAVGHTSDARGAGSAGAADTGAPTTSEPEHSAPASRERSHSPVPLRYGSARERDNERHTLRSSPFRGGRRAGRTGASGTPDRMYGWRAPSPASRTSSSIFSEERASPPLYIAASPSDDMGSPQQHRLAMRQRSRAGTSGDAGSSADIGRSERLRLQSLALHRRVRHDIAHSVRQRRTARETLTDNSKPTHLQLFGIESTPHGVSSTPRSLCVTGCVSHEPSPSQAATATAEELAASVMEDNSSCTMQHPHSECNKVVRILEMPLCPSGHRPTLIAQVNAQASPQFEQLGPYLVRIGCCKTCKVQVPSIIDLTREDVSGTSTDSLMVVSTELHKSVYSRQSSTIRAHRAKAGIPDADHSTELSLGVAQSCIIQQVRRESRTVSGPCTSATAAAAAEESELTPVLTQACRALWISCWVPTEPALEAPARNDVYALARMHGVPTPPVTQQAHSSACSKLGGNTRSAASPSCRLCCNRMSLVVSLPCDGVVVTQPRSCAMIVEVFKCSLHPQEMQCSWSCREDVSRPQEEPHD